MSDQGAPSTPPALPTLPTDDCCVPDPRIATHFDQRVRDQSADGALPEMVAVSHELLGLLADVSERRPTVLELGSGSGALSVALLERGAAAADGIDLSPQSVATARRRAEAAGVAERATFAVGDAAQAQVARHDWVVIDRVFCCYAHVDALLANAIGAAGQRIAFSLPESRGWRGLVTRFFVLFENATDRFRPRPCPNFIHDIRMIQSRLAAAGFKREREASVGMWHLAVWDRPAAST
jgi:SAM-dependent methyltransferase